MKTITVPTNKEHFEKYANLVKQKGLHFYVPATKEEIEIALLNGDFSLNTIKLQGWDGMAYQVGWTEKRDGKAFSSLSQRVCFLKHFAIFHVANAQPNFIN